MKQLGYSRNKRGIEKQRSEGYGATARIITEIASHLISYLHSAIPFSGTISKSGDNFRERLANESEDHMVKIVRGIDYSLH